jgi:hypothetical protein
VRDVADAGGRRAEHQHDAAEHGDDAAHGERAVGRGDGTDPAAL